MNLREATNEAYENKRPFKRPADVNWTGIDFESQRLTIWYSGADKPSKVEIGFTVEDINAEDWFVL